MAWLNSLRCWLRGHHLWGPDLERAEWWQGYEDVTDTGGLTMSYQRCGPNDEDAFLDEWVEHTCGCCGVTERAS